MPVKGLSNLTVKLSTAYWRSCSNCRTKEKRFNHKSMRNGTWHYSTKQKLQGLKDLHVKACLAHRKGMQLNTGVNIQGALQRCFLGIEKKEEWKNCAKELCLLESLVILLAHCTKLCLQILKSMLRRDPVVRVWIKRLLEQTDVVIDTGVSTCTVCVKHDFNKVNIFLLHTNCLNFQY